MFGWDAKHSFIRARETVCLSCECDMCIRVNSEFLARSYPNQPAQLKRLARKLEISLETSLDMIISNKQITKVLVRLHRCAGRSRPFLFSNPEDRFSHVEAQIKLISAETLNGPCRNKTCLRGFQQSKTQTSLLSYRD